MRADTDDPVRGAVVAVLMKDHKQERRSSESTTDRAGAFVLELPEGTTEADYFVSVVAPRLVPYRAPLSSPVPAEVAPIRLERGIDVVVEVTDEKGRACPSGVLHAIQEYMSQKNGHDLAHGTIQDTSVVSRHRIRARRTTLCLRPIPTIIEAHVLGFEPARSELFTPEPGDCAPLRLVIAAGKTLSAIVVDAAGAPIPGAIVRTFPEDEHGWSFQGDWMCPSDDRGQIRIPGLPDQVGLVTAEHPDYLRFEKGFNLPTEGEELRIELTPAQWITGRFVLPEGIAMPDNTKLCLEVRNRTREIPLCAFGAESAFRSAPFETEYASGYLCVFDGKPIAVSWTAGAGGHDLGAAHLTPAVSFHLTVLDGLRRPVSGAGVRLQQRNERDFYKAGMVAMSQTDAHGRAIITAFSREPQTLAVTRAGFATHEEEILPEAGEQEVGIEVVLAPAAAISLRVVDSRGQPIPSAAGAVFALKKGGTEHEYEPALVAAANPDGVIWFDRSGAPPCAAIVVRAAGYEPSALSLKPGLPSQGTDLGVVTLHDGIVIQGRVFDSAGDPVPNAEIRIEPGSSMFYFHGDRPKGLFEEHPQAGRSGPDGGFFLKGFLAGDHSITVRSVGNPPWKSDLSLSQSTPLVELTVKLEPGLSYEGLVLNSSGEPVAGVDFQLLVQTDNWESLFARSGAVGRFRFDGVRAAPVTLHVKGVKHLLGKARASIQAPLVTQLPGVVTLPDPATLEIVLRCASDVTPPQQVTLHYHIDAIGSSGGGQDFPHSPNGRVVMHDVAPADYELSVDAAGFMTTETQAFTVAPGEHKRVVFELVQSPYRLVVHVEDASGTSLARASVSFHWHDEDMAWINYADEHGNVSLAFDEPLVGFLSVWSSGFARRKMNEIPREGGRFTVVLTKECAFDVLVVDALGVSLRGADVWVRQADETGHVWISRNELKYGRATDATTDDGGMCRVGDLEAGYYQVSSSLNGMYVGRVLVQLVDEETRSVEVRGSAELHTISGEVSVNGIPVRGGILSLGSSELSVKLALDTEGKFSGDLIGAGTFKAGLGTPDGWLLLEREVTVSYGAALRIDFPSIVVRGRVVLPGGEPARSQSGQLEGVRELDAASGAAAALVDGALRHGFWSYPSSTMYFFTTDSDGRFVLSMVSPGKYVITASTEDSFLSKTVQLQSDTELPLELEPKPEEQ